MGVLVTGGSGKLAEYVMRGSNCAPGHGFCISQRPFPFRYLLIDEAHPSDIEDS